MAEKKRGNGALLGGFVCLLLAWGLIILPLPLFFIYLPLLLAAFVLALVAMGQERPVGGLMILLGVVIGSPMVWLLSWVLVAGMVQGFQEGQAAAKRNAATNGAGIELKTNDLAPKEGEFHPPRRLVTNEVPEAMVIALEEQRRMDEAAARKAEETKRDAASLLAWQLKLAAEGDSYGEFKIGMRYLTGNGVEKDPQKARELLAKAAAQGNQEARDELAKLPPLDSKK